MSGVRPIRVSGVGCSGVGGIQEAVQRCKSRGGVDRGRELGVLEL